MIEMDISEENHMLHNENATDPPRNLSVCPHCKGENIFMRDVEIRHSVGKVVLKEPGMSLARFFGVEGYDEIVGIACEDCGYVFFMLKDFVVGE
jgi:uncharacterized OB-fold protein